MKPIANFCLCAAAIALLSTVLLFAQESTKAASSAMVSNSTDGALNSESIKPAPVAKDTATDESIMVDPASLLPDLPPMPRANATLMGGTLEHLDRVRDRITLHVFGGGRTTALFDPRTRVFRGNKEVTIADLHEGERVYLDTILDGNTVFAKAIRLSASPALGESQGVVLHCRVDRGEMTVRDALSPMPIHVRFNSSTKFMQGNRAVSSSMLVPGALISIAFNAEGNGREVARQISILALPGTRYTFVGEVTHIDLRTGLLVLNSSIDRKTYEIYLDRSYTPDENLHPGATVTVNANFDGSRYLARSVTVDSANK